MRCELSFAPPDSGERPFRRAQTLPLKRRFVGPPPFALIAVPVLACTVAVFMMAPSDIATGLEVRLLPVAALRRDPIAPTVTTVVARANLDYAILVSSIESPVDHLEEALVEKLKLVPERRVYVEGDRAAAWGQVANVIDKAKHLQCEVIRLTTVPARNAKCGWPAAPTGDSRCRP